MRRRIVLFAIAIVLVASAMLPASSGIAAPPPIPGGFATNPILQPPFENGEPLPIKIGLHIVNIASIDEVNEQFR
jgi:hypothetical protein